MEAISYICGHVPCPKTTSVTLYNDGFMFNLKTILQTIFSNYFLDYAMHMQFTQMLNQAIRTAKSHMCIQRRTTHFHK